GTTNGLQKFDRIKNKFFRYIDKDRLLNIDIMGILEGKNGILWLHTKSGICRFNTQNRSLRFLDENDGLPAKDFYRYAYHENTRGDLYFGGNNKILVFNPAKIQKNANIPPIVITDFQIFNKSVKPGNDSPLSKSISNTDEIILPFNQSVFSFEFAALDYTIPDKNKYAYKMEGVDPDWVYSDASRRYVTYTHLDPGKYVLRIKGSNSDGVWNEEGASIRIIITPPWYQTWWAYSFYVLFIIGLIYSLRRYETNRQNLKHNWELKRVEAEKFQEINQLKSRFFANISHEFRTPLTLIKGPVQQLLSGDFKGNIEKQYKVILRNTNRLMKLINQLLDLSRLESGQMTLRLSHVNVVPLLKGLTHSFETLAKQKNIVLQFQAYENRITIYIDRDNFEKIIINLLSNAFKFTSDGGFVSVDINSVPDKVQGDKKFAEIKISNSGAGISPDKLDKIFDRFYQADDSPIRSYEGTGIGLALTKELVELHHGKITVESVPGKETTFTVYLPLGKNHLLTEEIIEVPDNIAS
ncbi:MAG TPA: ATP-binding protein, partial [Gillisia sp.]|nr:ATP-binding protein [Gillisia sp.]